MSDEIIDTIFVRGLQIFGKYHKSNPIEIRISVSYILKEILMFLTGRFFGAGFDTEESVLVLHRRTILC